MTDKPLTPKQEAFAAALAGGLSQAEAYRQAYPHSKKWKDSALHPEASRLAADPKVSARVEELRQKALDANEITIERIVREIARVAFADPRKVMRWSEGSMKLVPSDELTEDDAAIVAEVKETTSLNGGSISLKTHSKMDALKTLLEWKGAIVKKHELTGKGGDPLLPAGAAAGVLVVPAVLSEEDWVKAAKEYHDKQQAEKGSQA